MGHLLVYKTIFKKLESMKVIQSVFSDHTRFKPEINKRNMFASQKNMD